MITAVVRFKLPADVTLAAATELFKGSAPKYQNLPGLVRKYYLYGEGTGGGVYLWKSRADAEKVYTAEWRRMIADRYGAEPEITFFESPAIVDNERGPPEIRSAGRLDDVRYSGSYPRSRRQGVPSDKRVGP